MLNGETVIVPGGLLGFRSVFSPLPEVGQNVQKNRHVSEIAGILLLADNPDIGRYSCS